MTAQLVKNPPALQETPVQFLGQEDLLEKGYSWVSLVTQLVICLQCGDLGSVPGLARSPGEGKGYASQSSVLEYSMDCIVCGVAKRQTRLCGIHGFHKIEGQVCVAGPAHSTGRPAVSHCARCSLGPGSAQRRASGGRRLRGCRSCPRVSSLHAAVAQPRRSQPPRLAQRPGHSLLVLAEPADTAGKQQ